MDLKLGDCLGEEGLCTLADKSVDMILCDLPYGITANKWDKGLDLNALFKEYNRVIKDNGSIVLFGCQPFTTDLISANRKYFRYELIWSKMKGSNFINANKMPLKNHENILIFYKHLPNYNPQKTAGKPYKIRQRKCVNSHLGEVIPVRVCDLDKVVEDRHPKSVLNFKQEQGKHTTQKPVALCEWLIKSYTNEGELVLDNTFGSGTTAVACKNTNRRFVGWEKEETYYKIALERLGKV